MCQIDPTGLLYPTSSIAPIAPMDCSSPPQTSYRPLLPTACPAPHTHSPDATMFHRPPLVQYQGSRTLLGPYTQDLRRITLRHHTLSSVSQINKCVSRGKALIPKEEIKF